MRASEGECVLVGTFRSEDGDDYEYEFSVLSTRTSKNVGLQTLCACSVRSSSSSDLKVPSESECVQVKLSAC